MLEKCRSPGRRGHRASCDELDLSGRGCSNCDEVIKDVLGCKSLVLRELDPSPSTPLYDVSHDLERTLNGRATDGETGLHDQGILGFPFHLMETTMVVQATAKPRRDLS